LHKDFAIGKRLKNFRKLSRTRRSIGGQRAFHEVGNALLLESFERVVDGFEDYTLGSGRRRLFDFDHGAQSGANPSQNLLAT
jgi:hypothetical protein